MRSVLGDAEQLQASGRSAPARPPRRRCRTPAAGPSLRAGHRGGGRPSGREVLLDLEPGVMVGGNRLQLCRLLTNLLTNADRHTTSTVWVDVRREGTRPYWRSATTGSASRRPSASGSSSASPAWTRRAAATRGERAGPAHRQGHRVRAPRQAVRRGQHQRPRRPVGPPAAAGHRGHLGLGRRLRVCSPLPIRRTRSGTGRRTRAGHGKWPGSSCARIGYAQGRHVSSGRSHPLRAGHPVPRSSATPRTRRASRSTR